MKLLINRSVTRLLLVGKRDSAGDVFSYLLMCGAENHRVLVCSKPNCTVSQRGWTERRLVLVTEQNVSINVAPSGAEL